MLDGFLPAKTTVHHSNVTRGYYVLHGYEWRLRFDGLELTFGWKKTLEWVWRTSFFCCCCQNLNKSPSNLNLHKLQWSNTFLQQELSISPVTAASRLLLCMRARRYEEVISLDSWTCKNNSYITFHQLHYNNVQNMTSLWCWQQRKVHPCLVFLIRGCTCWTLHSMVIRQACKRYS